MRYVAIQTIVLACLVGAALSRTGPQLIPEAPAAAMAGRLFIGAAIVLVVAAYLSLGNSFRVAPAPRHGAELVTRGVYRYLRHPMYTAVVGLAVGIFLMVPTLFVGMAAVATTIFFTVKARHEEGLLRDKYAGYAAYAATSHGVIPLPRGSAKGTP